MIRSCEITGLLAQCIAQEHITSFLKEYYCARDELSIDLQLLFVLVTVSSMYVPDLLLELLQSCYSAGAVNQSDSGVL